VRVGADERVREREPVTRLDDAREILEIHLVTDAGVRGNDLEVVEGGLPPAKERVPLAVPLELQLDVPSDRETRRELVDLHRVIDDELDRDLRVDPLGVAALVVHRLPHSGKVDDARHAGEILEQDTRRREGDLARGLFVGDPARDRFDLRVASVPEDVLEQDAKRVGEPRDVPCRLQRVESVDGIARVADSKLLRFCHPLDSSRSAHPEARLVCPPARSRASA
jgi:hypothetical protein